MSDIQEILQSMHGEMATAMLKRLRSGDFTAADLNVMRQFLKDNGVEALPKAGTPIMNLATELPFTDENSVDQHYPN